MINKTELLLQELENQLSTINHEPADILQRSKLAIHTIGNAIEQLKEIVFNSQFADQQQEIYFFKSLKPRFIARLLYYKYVAHIEMHKPKSSLEKRRKYFHKKLKKFDKYFDNNRGLYDYLQSGTTHMDGFYFTRNKYAIDLYLNTFYFELDPRFTTSYDYKVARFMANEMLQQYLLVKLQELENTINIPQIQKAEVRQKSDLFWTAPKVDLVELTYALHEKGVFNNGNVELNQVADFMEKAFGIELGQYHRTFLELRTRKTKRTKFLDDLKDLLTRKMDAAEENNH